MEFEALRYINQLDRQIDETLKEFGGRMDAADRDFLERLDFMLSRFDTKGGNIAKTVKNIRYINEIRREVSGAVRSTYGPAVQAFTQTFSTAAVTMDLYFSATVAEYGTKAVYQAITQEYIAATIDTMYAGGLNARFQPVLNDILKTHVTTGAPLAQMRAQVRAAVIDSKQLSSYARVVADNALNQYSRNYLQAVSEDLGLEHYFYKGTVIEGSRDFCRTRVGKYFTEAEVLDWAGLSWSGKIKTTTRANIKTNLGGNGCRHRLAPISKELYERRKTAQKN